MSHYFYVLRHFILQLPTIIKFINFLRRIIDISVQIIYAKLTSLIT